MHHFHMMLLWPYPKIDSALAAASILSAGVLPAADAKKAAMTAVTVQPAAEMRDISLHPYLLLTTCLPSVICTSLVKHGSTAKSNKLLPAEYVNWPRLSWPDHLHFCVPIYSQSVDSDL